MANDFDKIFLAFNNLFRKVDLKKLKCTNEHTHANKFMRYIYTYICAYMNV